MQAKRNENEQISDATFKLKKITRKGCFYLFKFKKYTEKNEKF